MKPLWNKWVFPLIYMMLMLFIPLVVLALVIVIQLYLPDLWQAMDAVDSLPNEPQRR